MKNKSILVLSLCCIGALSGLAQENTLPTSGNVVIDSTLTVNDSALFRKNLRVLNTVNLEGGLNLYNLQTTNQMNNTDRFLVIDENGVIKRGNGAIDELSINLLKFKQVPDFNV